MLRDEQTVFHSQVQSLDQKEQPRRSLHKELSDSTESKSLGYQSLAELGTLDPLPESQS